MIAILISHSNLNKRKHKIKTSISVPNTPCNLPHQQTVTSTSVLKLTFLNLYNDLD